MRFVLLFIFTAILCTGCIGVFDYSYEKNITGRYYLTALDSREDMSLSYNPKGSDGMYNLVGSTVFAVGQDHDIVIAKQHPRGASPKNTTKYFILWIAKDSARFPEKGVIGPLTKEQFSAKMTELGRNIPFTTVIKDLE